jgi:hypothetical protein
MIELDHYKQAVFQLADKLFELKNEHGRVALLELTGLDVAKINQLTTIGSFINRTHNLLPEHYLEIAGLPPKQIKKVLDLAVKDKLSPCKLRRVIRKSLCKIHKKEQIKTNNFSKHLQLLQRELNNMDEATKQRAKEYLKHL